MFIPREAVSNVTRRTTSIAAEVPTAMATVIDVDGPTVVLSVGTAAVNPKKNALFEVECIDCINTYYYISHIKYMAYGKINVTERP